MPTEIVVYSCNHCGLRYDDVRQAAECEQRHHSAGQQNNGLGPQTSPRAAKRQQRRF